MKDNFSEIFSNRIIKNFLADVKCKQIDDPLETGELPTQFFIRKRFMLGEEFFLKNNISGLPLMLKKQPDESEKMHYSRVRAYLLSCPNDKFISIAEQIDP